MTKRYGIKKAYEDVCMIAGSTNATITENSYVIVMAPPQAGVIDWPKWVDALRFTAFFNQRGTCMCGEKLEGSGEMHHALITKADVRGMRDNDKMRIINHSYNVVLCHKICHDKAVRYKCLEYLKSIYGDPVMDWYDHVGALSLMRKF